MIVPRSPIAERSLNLKPIDWLKQPAGEANRNSAAGECVRVAGLAGVLSAPAGRFSPFERI